MSGASTVRQAELAAETDRRAARQALHEKAARRWLTLNPDGTRDACKQATGAPMSAVVRIAEELAHAGSVGTPHPVPFKVAARRAVVR